MDRKYNIIGEKKDVDASKRISCSFSEEDIISASNRGTYKRALKDLSSCGEISVFEEGNRIIVEILGEKVHLESNITDCSCSCPSKIMCRHIVAAIIAFGNLSDELPEKTKSDYKADTKTDLKSENKDIKIDHEYLSEIIKEAENIIAKGIMSCTENDSRTLLGLALKGGSVYKDISNLCRNCSEQINLMNSRSADFSQINAAGLFCRLYNTAKAMIGKNGKQLLEKNEICCTERGYFMCLGAYPWLSRSGYAGITAVLYEKNIDKFFTLNNTMPTFYSSTENAGIIKNLTKLLHSRSYWQNEKSIAAIIGINFSLINYKSDEHRRISSSKQTNCVSGDKINPEDIPEKILMIPENVGYDYFSRKSNEYFFAVKNPQIKGVHFNASMQNLEFFISGKNIKEIECVIKYNNISENAISFIEEHNNKRFDKSSMLMRKYENYFCPISIITDENIRNIYF